MKYFKNANEVCITYIKYIYEIFFCGIAVKKIELLCSDLPFGKSEYEAKSKCIKLHEIKKREINEIGFVLNGDQFHIEN